MTTTFVSLPSVAANGAGTAVDVSNFACTKTLVNGGNGYVFEPQVAIEISNDAGAVNWTAIYTFQGPGEVTINVVARWMRTRISNYRGGTAPNVDVGADLEAAAFAALTSTAGSGSGTPVDTSTLPLYKTVQVVGAFRGTLNIQVSEDGVSYGPWLSFAAAGAQSAPVTAQWMRTQRVGVPDVDPGQPTVAIAADTGPGGGGGGGSGSGVDVQNEGVALVGNPYSTLNVESGVQALNSGGGVADIRSAVATATLTFRPGSGETGPTVFDDFEVLYTKLVQLRTDAGSAGKFTIVFDPVSGSTEIPPRAASAVYDMTRTEWLSTYWMGNPESDQYVSVLLGNGGPDQVFITNLAQATGLTIFALQTDPPIIIAPAVTNNFRDQLTLIATRIINSGDATKVIEVRDGGVIRLLDDASIASGAVTVLFTSGNGYLFLDGANAKIDANTLGSSVAVFVFVYLQSSSATVSFDQPSLTTPFAWLNNAFWRAWPAMPVLEVALAGGDPPTGSLTVGYTNLIPTSAGIPEVSLPLAASYDKGDFLTVKSGATAVSILGSFGDLIDGSASYALAKIYDSVTLVSDGISNWYVVAKASLTPSSLINEQWAQNDVAASQTAVALSCQVSTNFDSYKAIRAGSITGIGWRLSEATTNGTLTVTVSIDGSPIVLTGVSTNASNQSGGQSSQAAGIATFTAGQLITVQVTTTGAFTPITTDLEVILDAVFASA